MLGFISLYPPLFYPPLSLIFPLHTFKTMSGSKTSSWVGLTKSEEALKVDEALDTTLPLVYFLWVIGKWSQTNN